MKPVRILLVDDHEIMRRGLRAILTERTEWQICGEASTGREAVDQAELLKPDVVVMDLIMPELNGLEATRRICRADPRAEVLILSVNESMEIVREVFQAGARGYLLKSDLCTLLVQAVESVRRHRPFLTPKFCELIVKDNRAWPHEGALVFRHSLLSSREREILQLVAEGRSTKEVAHLLGISVKTAENHRGNIMRKLGFHSVAEIVRFAVRNNIIAP